MPKPIKDSGNSNKNNSDTSKFKHGSPVQKDGIMSKEPEYSEEQQIEPTTPESRKVQTDAGVMKKEPLVNSRHLSKDAETYELEKFGKNILLIFNHEYVHGHERREGTEKDVEDLTSTFKNCGFKVEVKDNKTYDEIKKILHEFTSQDFTNFGCVAVAVLTHGRDEGQIMASDRAYNEVEIINLLHASVNPSLLTKPRLVIVQACRGRDSVKGLFTGGQPATPRDHGGSDLYSLPVESDLLLFHSSYIGKSSFRDPELGSWCIQALCKKINELAARTDLESILTEVKREVAIDKWDGWFQPYKINKQMPVTMSTLTRKLYFRNYRGVASRECDYVDRSANIQTQKPATDISTPTSPTFEHVHYEYINKCLRKYVEDHPDDKLAPSYLEVAKDMKGRPDKIKNSTTKIICNYLKEHCSDKPFYEYLYFGEH